MNKQKPKIVRHIRTLKVQPPGGKVQPEKHTTIKTDRGEFKFREPIPSDWK